jgi:hypothetical protein
MIVGRINFMTEHQEQAALFSWANMQTGKYPELRLMFAVPNGSNKSMAAAVKFKAEGLKSGVPDIFLPVARGTSHGLFIEMKQRKVKQDTKRNVKGQYPKISDEQKAWLTALSAQGYSAWVAFGAEEAKDIILTYLKGVALKIHDTN